MFQFMDPRGPKDKLFPITPDLRSKILILVLKPNQDSDPSPESDLGQIPMNPTLVLKSDPNSTLFFRTRSRLLSWNPASISISKLDVNHETWVGIALKPTISGNLTLILKPDLDFDPGIKTWTRSWNSSSTPTFKPKPDFNPEPTPKFQL